MCLCERECVERDGMDRKDQFVCGKTTNAVLSIYVHTHAHTHTHTLHRPFRSFMSTAPIFHVPYSDLCHAHRTLDSSMTSLPICVHSVCVCVCVCVYVYVCVCVCMFEYIYIYIYMYVCMYIYIYIYLSLYTYIDIYRYI